MPARKPKEPDTILIDAIKFRAGRNFGHSGTTSANFGGAPRARSFTTTSSWRHVSGIVDAAVCGE
jgi:hypothetical protein